MCPIKVVCLSFNIFFLLSLSLVQLNPNSCISDNISPFTATFPNPGPPIQTTPFNKGPEGANLFVFHIPNDMTNQTMYEMFAPFGNLLSVRIMVEKDTGRSRGFGFVSYDSPESAAAAIKALNGHIVSLLLVIVILILKVFAVEPP